jgi:hypothetical protein
MKPKDDSFLSDPDQSDALDAYLDDLARDRAAPPLGLDPALAATARRVQDLADLATDANIRTADKQRTWEALMQYASTPTVVPLPLRRTNSAPAERRQPPSYPKRLVRTAARPLGLVATLTLVVLVGLSAVAVYRVAPGRQPDPTSIPAAIGGTAIAETPQPDEADPVWGTLDDGTTYVHVPWGTCDVAPAEFEDVMDTIFGPDYPFEASPPQPQIAGTKAGPNGTLQFTFGQLPPGEPVSDDVIAALVETYETYLGCDGMPLRQAPLFTPEGLVREYLEAPSIYLYDGGVDGGQIGTLWSDHMGRQGVDEDHLGRLSFYYLYDFRLLDTGQVVAFLSYALIGESPQFYVEAGYVLFEQQNGQWLIDEQFRRPPPMPSA